ncbi:MAG: hypothetical protein GC154_12305 [bacterium]|nr:hypothetical protein [bacterium]
MNERFELALERIKETDWYTFESFSINFLQEEFPDIRSKATSSGDKGRDAEVISLTSSPLILIQCSTSKNWKKKINDTVEKIKKSFKKCSHLIYCTNQKIGALSDDLVKDVRNSSAIMLDIRDRSWFVMRANSTDLKSMLSEELCKKFVDVLLHEKNVINLTGCALDEEELKAAHLFLSIIFSENYDNKNLTKLSFESIVRCVMRNTNESNKMKIDGIVTEVKRILPSHSEEKIKEYAKNALLRLTGCIVKDGDEYYLTSEEISKRSEQLAIVEKEKNRICDAIIEFADICVSEERIKKQIKQQESKIVESVFFVIDKYLLSRGELFASMVNSGSQYKLAYAELKDLIRNSCSQLKFKISDVDQVDFVYNILIRLFSSPSLEIVKYFRSVVNSYTIMAFLRETPDVQKTIKKLFGSGEIWLDTNIVLPMFAETLLENDESKLYTKMISSAQAAGLSFYVIPGVIEEIKGHLLRSLKCMRTSKNDWIGPIPFLYSY